MKKLSPKALGLSMGVMWGVCLAVWTLSVLLAGTQYSMEVLTLIGAIYPRFDVSLSGVFLGLVYGFIDGFIGGYVLAWLYNRFTK